MFEWDAIAACKPSTTAHTVTARLQEFASREQKFSFPNLAFSNKGAKSYLITGALF